jgi:hypothetical protein
VVKDNSQRLNYFLLPKDNLFDDLINKIFINLKKEKNKVSVKSDLNDKLEIKRLINSLYQAYYSIPPIVVSLSLKKSKYTKSGISYTSLKRVFDYLKDNKYINYKLGSEYSGKVTRISASGKLTRIFDKIGFVWRKYYNPTENLILFRDKIKIGKKLKAIDLDTPITNKIIKYKNNISKINEELLKHCLCLKISDQSFKELEKELRKKQNEKPKYFWREKNHYTLNFSQVSLRRIFTRKIGLHGRFYGGWWQSVPSKFRPHITIDGYNTSEVDYSTNSLRILYAKENIKVDDDIDLYDIGISNYNPEKRDLIKEYTNAIINDPKGNFRLDKINLNKLGLTHNKLKDMVYKRHKLINKYFGVIDEGLKVMYLDSVIAEDILLNLLKNNVVVLPIHDSFIVRTSHRLDLEDQMNKSFKKIMGVKGKIKSTGPLSYKMFNKGKEPADLTDIKFKYIEDKNSNETINKNEFKRYYKYLDSWNEWKRSNPS